ncbi:hypothetical protein DFH08DRAFT_957648 [Mycena albidolilacea]|uniref:Uncharacterized protein n=1 Tax=Mycena albidolilacea TaxID=1033008 RepID=A0AAD7A8B4_9AGAR|nr:hypothetical protein DFH08DRAFT_957648 [Mycena albidolilacea]
MTLIRSDLSLCNTQHICQPSFWSTSLTGPGPVPDCDFDLSTYYPAAPARRTAAAAAAHHPPYPLVTPAHPLAALAAPCVPPATTTRYSAAPARCTPWPRLLLWCNLLVALAYPLVAWAHPPATPPLSLVAPPPLVTTALPPSTLAAPLSTTLFVHPLITPPHLPDLLTAPPHHRTTAPNAVLPPLPAASACLSPCFPDNLLSHILGPERWSDA